MEKFNDISMGYAVEGESYVGKTTSLETIKNLEQLNDRGIIVVPEYSMIGKLPKFPAQSMETLKKNVQQIIDLEKRRTDFLISQLDKNKNAKVFFDRSPVSCIAFERAAKKHGYKDATLWLAEEFQKEIEQKNIIIPSGIVLLTASQPFIEERKQLDLKEHNKIIDFLQEPEVISSINNAYITFKQFMPKQMFLMLNTDNKNPNQVSAEILQLISSQPANVLKNIPDFVSYAESLIGRKHD